MDRHAVSEKQSEGQMVCTANGTVVDIVQNGVHASVQERTAQKAYWQMYAPEASVEAMMLDSNAAEIDREERPEVCGVLYFLSTDDADFAVIRGTDLKCTVRKIQKVKTVSSASRKEGGGHLTRHRGLLTISLCMCRPQGFGMLIMGRNHVRRCSNSLAGSGYARKHRQQAGGGAGGWDWSFHGTPGLLGQVRLGF